MTFSGNRLIDPGKAITKVENYQMVIYQTAMTTFQNVVGQNILDDFSASVFH